MMNDDDHCQEMGKTSTKRVAAYTRAFSRRGREGGGYIPSVLGSAHCENSLSGHFGRLFSIHHAPGNSQSCLIRERQNDLSEIDVKIKYAARELSGDEDKTTPNSSRRPPSQHS
jgi:hypothetical protein